MTQNNSPRVLAIGLDAAEPTLIRHFMEEGWMPALQRLLERGAWKRVRSPAVIGSGAVWPTFITGSGPREHGIYGEWEWQPGFMSVKRYSGRGLIPFWKSLAREGTTIGVLDIPFAPTVGLSEGFEISEWGAHDVIAGQTEVRPESLSALISQTRPHPFQAENVDASGPDDLESLARLRSACLDGVKLRGELARRLIQETGPQLAVVVFTEIHHAAHYFWHAIAPDHPSYAGDKFHAPQETSSRALREIYREVDEQIARLVEVAGEDAFTCVFSLHGMRPTFGIPSFLTPLLIETGWAHLADWSSQSWRARLLSLFAAAKRRAPSPLKKLYYKTLPRTATFQLAQTTMLPPYDWSRTRAFSLPTDQHGWIRLNLVGREAAGVVPPEEYEETCREIERMLLELVTEDGEPLVRDCLMTSRGADEALAQLLPDIVVHYTDAAFRERLKIKGTGFEAGALGQKFTGQHAPEGFLLAAGAPEIIPDAPVVPAEDLHRLMTAALNLHTVTH
ncbi:MAG TPA: alkaline phosphatase family protein [Pyrinomonadaceae bacterium]|nr:alkaline phosphatase family protein [Pyrinomonadaceae bacterium]